ncbi:MAG: DUF2017 family protein [bacterium]|nr:DUF2017 family protein [bacterium]MCY3579813.1 DUF2017 family protein [bacterium]MCY3652861.1 DUF2017 family protein [bacterium]MDE0643683.1 DUF2017 family protein [bacterium]
MTRFNPSDQEMVIQEIGDDRLVLSLMSEVLTSVGNREEDPATERLSVAAYPDDEEAQTEYERFMQSDLVTGRRIDQAVVDTVIKGFEDGPVSLSWPDAESLLMAVNEARVVIGARLGIESDDWEPDEEVAGHPVLALLRYLTGYQDELIGVLAGRL